jgi:hypothetical protein
VAQYTAHCVQETIENRAGCFEWFGLDFMVDDQVCLSPASPPEAGGARRGRASRIAR